MSLYYHTDDFIEYKITLEKIYEFSSPKIFNNLNQVLSNFNQFFTIMYINKKFVLLKFYNNGLNYFFCGFEKKINILPKGSWMPPISGRRGSFLGWISVDFVNAIKKTIKNACAKFQLRLATFTRLEV